MNPNTIVDRMWDGQSMVDLTYAEQKLIGRLHAADGEPVSHDELSVAMRGRPLARHDDRTIHVAIFNLRRKAPGLPIRTAHGMGYLLLKAPVAGVAG